MASIQPRANGWRVQVRRGADRASRCFETREEAEAWAQRKEFGFRLRKPGTLASRLPKRVLDALERVDVLPEEVLHGAIPAPASCGIYFLIRAGEIVYVGKSKDVFLRLSKHRRDGKVFDAYNFLPCPEDELDDRERMYIEAFMPSGNFRL